MVFGSVVDIEEDAAHLRVVGAAAAVEAHAAGAAREKRGAEMALECPNAVGDGRRGNAKLGGRQGEALVPGGSLEEWEGVERREGFHGVASMARDGGMVF